jgi:hypothetical protein
MQSKNYREGIALFNQHSFFEAHEVLEDVWRAAPERERKFLQGLIQVAVALHHHSRGNLVGCRSLLDRVWAGCSTLWTGGATRSIKAARHRRSRSCAWRSKCQLVVMERRASSPAEPARRRPASGQRADTT